MEKRNVLFVDDEEKILHALKRGLVDEPYEIFFADSGREALGVLKHSEIHVIVTDMRMPEMDGLELLKKVKAEYPHVIRIVLSGYADIEVLLAAINQGEIFRFMTKPWKLNEEIKTTIRQAIEFYNLHVERELLMHFVELWLEGLEPELINVQFLQELVSARKKHLYEWKKKCASLPVGQKTHKLKLTDGQFESFEF